MAPEPTEAPTRHRWYLAQVGVAESTRRHWPLVATITAVVLAFSLLLGFARAPVYTAEARLNVGRLDVSTQAIPGFVSSVQALAATYSRLVDAQDVINATAKATSTTPGEISGSLTASPIADSPLFRLNATAGSADDAVIRANAAAEALADYVSSLNTENPDGERLLDQFREASTTLAAAQAALARAKRAAADNPTTANRNAVDRAQVEVDAARLQATTFSSLYQQSQQGSVSANVVTIFDPASTATSDRRSALQRFLFVGLVAGLLLGVVAATVIENLPDGVRKRTRGRIDTLRGRVGR